MSAHLKLECPSMRNLIRQTLLEKRRRPIWIMTVAWVLPVCWVASLPPPGQEWRGLKRTHTALQSISSVLKAFEKNYHDLPQSLAELKAFAKKQKINFPLIDGYGQSFELLHFGGTDFAVRSFGADGRQNTLESDPDPSIVSWSGAPEEGMHYAYEQEVVPTIFPAPLLFGSSSPSGPWTAELLIDPVNQTKNLLVRSRQHPTSFMIAAHDQVEEFLWMPNGFQIVFTATGSHRMRDGVFLWNLIDDSLITVFDGTTDSANLNMMDASASGQAALTLAMAGISEAGPTILFYASTAGVGAEIDPVAFHALKNLRAIRVSQVTGSPPTLDPINISAQSDWSALGAGPPRYGLWTEEGSARLPQQEWMDLPYKGPIEEVISSWQSYGGKYATSPILPYCIWTIAALYADAYADLHKKSAKDADTLRAFGGEMAKKLEDLSLAPRYLRQEGRFVKNRLSRSESIPFRLAEYTRLPE